MVKSYYMITGSTKGNVIWYFPVQRRMKLKQVLKSSACCVCGGIPQVEVLYKLEGATRLEKSCGKCKYQVFQKIEPQTHGCIIGNIPPTSSE